MIVIVKELLHIAREDITKKKEHRKMMETLNEKYRNKIEYMKQMQRDTRKLKIPLKADKSA